MVKNIPTIERSTKIRFGKHATDDQGENTIVFNASNVAIDTSVSGSIYMTPLRQEDDITSRDITMLTYNTETKEIIDSNVLAVDLFSINLQYATNNDNVTSNTVRFINDTTAFVTTGNVGIHNTSPTHALDVGSQFHVTEGGEVRIGPSVLIDSSVTNQIQVSGRIDTDSITLDHIGIANNNPTITGLSLGSTTFLQNPTASINAFSTTGNVSAAFYHGDSYFLSNLTLDNIVLQGNTTASRTVQFNYANGPALITNGNVGIQNTHGIHTLDVGSNLFVDDIGSNILVVTGNTFTSRKTLIGSNVTIDTLGSNVVEVTGNTYTSRKALVGSNVTIDTLGSNVVEVTGNTYTSRKALVGSNVTIDTLGTNVVEVTGNTYTSRKALIGSNVTIDTLGSNVVEVTGNTFTSRKALVGSNLVMDTLGSNVVEVTGNVNVSNYTKTDYITVQKDAHIKGNLLVEGTTTTIDTTNTTFEDSVISLANNNELTTTDIGIIMKQPGSNANPTVTFRGDEKEIMIGYTLNSSLDTEITPDSANVIDLHVYGNVIAQNNITLTSGELTAITLNGNVIGNNVDVVTLTGNVIGNNVDVVTLTGNVIGNNVDVITLTGNDIGNNVDVITLTGNVIGNNVDVTNNIETTSGFFKGDGGILSNVTLQQVTDAGNTTSNTVQFTNAHTAFTTDLTSNVGVKLNQLSNVNVTGLVEDNILIYDGSNWVNDYNVHNFVKIKNETGDILYRGNTVYIVDGHNSNVANVALAKSDLPNTMPCIGIIHDDVANQGEGVAVAYGKVQNVNTSGFTEGQTVYVSNTVAGSVMSSKPFVASDLIQNVGVCVKSDPSHGVIFVTGVGRSNDIPNAQVVTDQPSYVYVNSIGNELKKINPRILNANNQTLDMVTSWSNSTTNTIASTNTTTGFISSGNVHVGSNIQVSGLSSGFVPIVGSDKFLHDSVIEYSGDTTTISSNVEITGNLLVLGNTFTVESNSLVINDRVLGIANNNVSHSLDVGIIMEHPGHNIAFIHHGEPAEGDPHEHEMVLGYTQNTVSDNHVLDDANLITFRVLGNVIVQNNLTLTSGDLTAITVNSNVVGDNVSAITLNGNVSGDNVNAITLYGNVSGDNVSAITLNGNVSGDNVNAITLYGNVSGDNVNVITLNGNVVGNTANVITLNGNVVGNTANVITLNGNVSGDNVNAITLYGNVSGDNVSAITLYGNVSGDNVNTITLYGNVIGNNVDVITLTGNVSGDNVSVITLNGNVSGDNVSVITLNGNVSGDNVNAITLNGNVSGDNVSAITLNGNVSGDNVSAITLNGNVSGDNVSAITLNGNVSGDNVSAITLNGNVSGDNVSVI